MVAFLGIDLPAWAEETFRFMLEEGLPITLKIAGISIAASASIGIVLGTLLTIRFLPLRTLIRLYIEVWRGLPIIVTILLVYFGLPELPVVGHRFDAFTAATIALSLWGSAQVAEATRGAVQSIPREQHEASAALGFGWVGRHVFVIVPQAFRRLLPPMVGLLVNVIQNTTVAYVIGVNETLTAGARQSELLLFDTGNSHAIAIYGFVLVIFFAISFPLTRLAAHLEKRLI